MKVSNLFFLVLLVVPLCAWPGVHAVCISSGTEATINAKLTGVGASAILCANAVFTLSSPVTFTANNQQIYTEGLPTGSTRAILRVTGVNQTTAIDGSQGRNGIIIKNIQVDGNRPALGVYLGDGRGANIEIGNAWSQVIDNVYSHDPRGWSCMHITQGRDACHNATVSNNQVGPAGNPNGTWADGISLECRDSLVTNNVVTDATDGAIVIFGSPGSVIRNNSIIAATQVLLGGINMVDYGQYINDSYLNTRVLNNTINAQGALIKNGIAMGPQVWACPAIGTISGAIVQGNTITGPHFGYGFPINGVQNFTVTGNVDNAQHVGFSMGGCSSTTARTAGFQYQKALASTLQPQYVSANLNYTLGVLEPSCGVFTANQGLYPGQTQKSCDGRFSLTLQTGGNLVETFGATSLWNTSTTGKNSSQALMQADGNFVIYNTQGFGIWSTGTPGNDGAKFSIQNDGNMVIYTANGTAIWSSGTCCH